MVTQVPCVRIDVHRTRIAFDGRIMESQLTVIKYIARSIILTHYGVTIDGHQIHSAFNNIDALWSHN